MAVVHDQHPQINPPGGEVILHVLAPPLFFTLGHLGKAVARQVNQIAFSVKDKIINVDGLSRLVPDPGKILPLEQPVDHRGLAYVGLSREGDLRQAVLGKILGGGGGNQKFHILKIHLCLLIGAAPAFLLSAFSPAAPPTAQAPPDWADSAPLPAQCPPWTH